MVLRDHWLTVSWNVLSHLFLRKIKAGFSWWKHQWLRGCLWGGEPCLCAGRCEEGLPGLSCRHWLWGALSSDKGPCSGLLGACLLLRAPGQGGEGMAADQGLQNTLQSCLHGVMQPLNHLQVSYCVRENIPILNVGMVVTFKACWRKKVSARDQEQIFLCLKMNQTHTRRTSGCRQPKRYTNHRAAGAFSRCSQWYWIPFPCCPPLLLILRFSFTFLSSEGQRGKELLLDSMAIFELI